MKLRRWYAVHGRIDVSTPPAAMLDSIRPRVTGLTPDFRIENNDWRDGSFLFPPAPGPMIVVFRRAWGDETNLWDRDDWEAELRSWGGPNCDDVIEHMRNVRQTINVQPIALPAITALGRTRLARICEQICGHLARATDGLIYVYQEGFFNSDGESLLPYCPQHRLKTK